MVKFRRSIYKCGIMCKFSIAVLQSILMAQPFLDLNTKFGFFMFGFLTGIGAGGAAGCTAGYLVGKKIASEQKASSQAQKFQRELREIKERLHSIEQKR